MSTTQYRIAGGDFDSTGSASGRLKGWLKRVGAEASAARRAIIAAYEAEMNVVIHATAGEMRVALSPEKLDVEVSDQGPGIPDIDRAMQEGFSTASPEAAALGFGAGLGLPNIRKHSDRFAIHSDAGKGTTLNFTVYLNSEAAVSHTQNSIRTLSENCHECRRCLFACPTCAVRVHGGRPQVLGHLCIDCAECIRACRWSALALEGRDSLPVDAAGMVVVPPPFLFDFGDGVPFWRALAALNVLGFREIRVTSAWETALRQAVAEYSRQHPASQPVISPLCPAVVNLVELRFPSLIENLAPFLSPIEAAYEELRTEKALFVTLCPSQHTVLRRRSYRGGAELVSSDVLRRAAFPHLAGEASYENRPMRAGEVSPVAGSLEVRGMKHVLAALEEVEGGRSSGIEVLEPYACEQGCFDSPLLNSSPFISQRRWRECRDRFAGPGRAFRREEPYVPRAGLRLDDDMGRAIEKLSKISEITAALPGRDCGGCGAPSCEAFAEDIVLGRAHRWACLHLGTTEER